jgi:hypothetical protein
MTLSILLLSRMANCQSIIYFTQWHAAQNDFQRVPTKANIAIFFGILYHLTVLRNELNLSPYL